MSREQAFGQREPQEVSALMRVKKKKSLSV